MHFSVSESEVVVPLLLPGGEEKVLGVLDIDSSVKERFTESLVEVLQEVCESLVRACDWEDLVRQL